MIYSHVMSARPHGSVAFVFTDVEGSTRNWERHAHSMRVAMARHDELLRFALTEQAPGYVFATGGDGFGVAFPTCEDAVHASLAAQALLATEQWPEPLSLRVRMGAHLGVADERDGNYFGPAVNRAARIMAAAHGGQLVASQLVAESIPPDVERVHLGVVRLKDLDSPESVWQLGPGRFPPLRSVRRDDVRLPEATTSLVGRDMEIGDLERLVREHRLVTITGPGGIGKTRSALAAAGLVSSGFAGGVAFVDLATLDASGDVAAAIARTLSLRRQGGISLIDTISSWLGGGRSLLVLDNCEHVVAQVRSTIDRILTPSSDVHILATSRSRLGHPLEQVFVLQPIGVAHTRELLTDRILAADPRFDPERWHVAIDELSIRLDGMPLAVELAAARCRTLTPDQLIERIDAGSELLEDRVRSDRHRSVSVTIRSSIEELEPAEALALSRCSVFSGPFELSDFAKVVVGVDETDVRADVIAALTESSLLQRDPNSGLFSMLAPIRWEAARLLSADDAVARRYSTHYAELATSALEGQQGPDQARCFALVEQQLANFASAHARALERDDVATASQLVFGLWLTSFTSVMTELVDWAESTTRAARGRLGLEGSLARSLAAALPGYLHLGRYDQVIDSRAEIEQLGDHGEPVLGMAWCIEGIARMNMGDGEGGAAAMRRGAEACGTRGEHYTQTMALLVLLEIDRAVEVAKRSKAPSLEAWIEIFSGFANHATGRPEAALVHFERAALLARTGGDIQAIGVARNEIGVTLAMLEDRPLADVIGPLGEALDMWKRLRTPFQLWNTLEAIAQTVAANGRIAEAATLWAAIDAADGLPPSRSRRSEQLFAAARRCEGAVEAGARMDIWAATEVAERVISELATGAASNDVRAPR